MLQVSDSAATVLADARAAQEVPDSYGVRVFSQPGDDGQAAVAIAFAESPVEGDQISAQAGTEVYVAPDVAEAVSERVLDVADTPQGPALALLPQEPAGA